MRGLIAILAGLAVSCLGESAAAQQDSHGVRMSPSQVFTQQGGEAIYRSVCAGCHMPKGEGAVGAGSYPKLAGNPNLEVASYPLTVVMLGLRGMPPLRSMLTDRQAADVVNYVRTNFGNAYTSDPATETDAASLRP